MSTRGKDDDADAQLDLFRQEVEAAGFDPRPAEAHQESLETADNFVARMKQAEEDASHAVASRPNPGRSRLRRWTVTTVGVAAAVALVLVVVRPGATPAAAAAPPVLDFEFASAVRIAYAPGKAPDSTLRLLADAAAAQPDGASGSGDIQYKKSDNWYAELDDAGSSKIVPRVSETWLRPDGSLTSRDTIGAPLDAGGRVVTRGPGRQVASETLPAKSVPADFARSLPKDPSLLAAALLRHSECESTEKGDVRSMCLYREIVALAQTYVMSPNLTKAIWSMLRSESGFRSLGSVKDRAGRDALGISIIDTDEPQVRHLLLGSLDGGQVVGFEDILIRRDPDLDVDPPSVLSFSTIVESRHTSTGPS